MKRRAEFDAVRFGADVKARLGGRSYRDFIAQFDHLTVKTLSHAVNAQPLGVANILALCAAMDLKPFDYFSIRDQAVTVPVSRVTLRERKGLGAIVDRMRGAQ